MNQQELNNYRAAASLGLIPDEENPLFLFNGTSKDMLLDIIGGRVNAIQLARIELENRGLDVNTGKWIGWHKKAANV